MYPERTLKCISKTAALRLTSDLHEADYPEATACAGGVVVFSAHPVDALHVAEHAFANGLVSDDDAAALIATL